MFVFFFIQCLTNCHVCFFLFVTRRALIRSYKRRNSLRFIYSPASWKMLINLMPYLHEISHWTWRRLEIAFKPKRNPCTAVSPAKIFCKSFLLMKQWFHLSGAALICCRSAAGLLLVGLKVVVNNLHM